MDTKSDLLRKDITAQINYGFKEEEIICNLKTKGHSDDDILAEQDLFLSARKSIEIEIDVTKIYMVTLALASLGFNKGYRNLLLKYSWNTILITGICVSTLLLLLFRKQKRN
jgi:hypothetical protein